MELKEQNLLLTDEEIESINYVKDWTGGRVCAEYRAICKAQLAKAKPLIEEQAKREERERIIKMPCWLAQSHNVACPIRHALKEGEL